MLGELREIKISRASVSRALLEKWKIRLER